MATTAQGRIEHRHLRGAIELALTEAEAGGRQLPPLAFPAELRPFLRSKRVPTAALGRLRRAIEADDAFRARVAEAADPQRLDAIGLEWLRHADGWRERVRALVDAADETAEAARSEGALRRAERRRQAAEEAAERERAEAAAQRHRADALAQLVDQAAERQRRSDAETARLAAELADARRAERHAKDRAEAANARLAAAEADRDAARVAADAAAAQRDVLLAERAERGGVPVSTSQVTELRALADSARRVADRLADLVDVAPGPRRPLALPGGVAGDSVRAVDHLLRVPRALVVVDGYNVAKLAWPDEALIEQRQRALDLIDDLARRTGSEVTVVFDGADVVGSHAPRRRLARVVYSPAGTLADDVIRATVAGVPNERPVVVVTSDRDVRRSVAAMGANTISSDAFLAFARR
jgi:predicted RNA-binding protein with PIN domain